MSGVDTDDSVSMGISLFRSLEEKGKYMNRANTLHSVVMVGKISPHVTDIQNIGKFFESQNTKLDLTDQITGVLLVYPYHVINVIEASFRTLIKLMRKLSDSEKIIKCYISSYLSKINSNLEEDESPKPFTGFDKATIKLISERHNLGPLINNKILSVTDNVVHRLYRTYEVLIFDMEPTQLSAYDSSEPDEKTLCDILNQLTRLAVFLAEEPMKGQDDYIPEIFKIKLTNLLKRLREDHPELVPQQVFVGYLADSSTYEGIIPLEEYVNFYAVPYETILQSELTWPVQKRSFFYY